MLPLIVRRAGAVKVPGGLGKVHEWRDRAGDVCAHSYAGHGEWWIVWRQVAFRFAIDGAVEAFPDPELSDAAVTAFFERLVKPLVLQALGWETLHASAVSTPGGLVAFCGQSGCGKSTVAYALSRAGHEQRADDAVVIQFGSSGARALVLPFDVRLRPASESFFGGPALERAPRGWRRPDPGPHHAERLAAFFVMSRHASGQPVVKRLAAAKALQALLPHARCFDAVSEDVRRRVLGHYLELAATVPVFDLRFAAGLHDLPLLVRSIEEAAGLRVMEPA